MRHGRTVNHLGRTASHRKALMGNMAASLIIHKRITTTVAKAKELKKFVEPLITKAKDDSTHSRRVVFSYLQSKDAVKELFGTVAEKVGSRPGGYTRVLKLMNRKGDNAEMSIIELVDFNEVSFKDKSKTATRTRRSRKPATKKESAADATISQPNETAE
jgi:large subunit ribosomal protein L17